MKKFRTFIILALLLAAAVGAFIIIRDQRQAAAAIQYQTETVQRGDLLATIGATGTVRADQTAILAWGTSGAVEAVNVKAGDHVEAGVVLAALSQTSLSQNIILAQAELVNAQRALDNLLNSDTPAAQAQLALVNAQKAYDNAENSLESLQSKQRGVSEETIANAEAQYYLALDAVEKAQESYDRFSDRSDDDPLKAQAYTTLYNAWQSRDRAKSNLNYYRNQPSAISVDEAEAKLALTQAQLNDAQREWDRLKDGPDAADVVAAQARVTSIQATLNLVRLAAPFAGTVTEARPQVGDQVSPGTAAFRIDDLARLLVDVQVSEVDINTVEIGQPVVLTFDAILGAEYHGEVVSVAQVGSVTQGAVNFTVTVELSDADEAIKPGMTAAVTITVMQLADVLQVPNRAVRLVDGQYTIYLLKGGLPEAVTITLGASSGTYSEVLSGNIEEGDIVVLNPPSNLFGGPDEGPGFFRP